MTTRLGTIVLTIPRAGGATKRMGPLGDDRQTIAPCHGTLGAGFTSSVFNFCVNAVFQRQLILPLLIRLYPLDVASETSDVVERLRSQPSEATSFIKLQKFE
jgi:hypothetical protein